MKRFLGFLLFLVLAEDWGCLYVAHMAAPLAWIHTLLLDPLPIKLRPFDLILLGILITGSSKRDGAGPPVPAMKNALLMTAGTTVFYFVYGMVHGGDARNASWQVYLILSFILLAFTLATTFRTAEDYAGLAKWLILAASYRALMCWISYFSWGQATLGNSGAYLTTHDDTVGWVVSIMVLIVDALDKRKARVTLRNVALMAFFVGAIQFNSRRLAWVSLAMGLIVMFLLFPQGAVRRRVSRVLVVLAPVLLVYVVVGWGSNSPIFLPLRSLSTVSTQEDSSTLARNVENLGLIATANTYGSLFGSGWGKPYICLSTKYDISSAFELWQYMPHNSILGLLAFTGIVGSAVFWITIATSVFMNARVARLSTDSTSRNVAIIGAAQVIVCANQLYGDMGIFFFKPMYVLGISCAMALRLPRATGVWNLSAKR